MIRKGANFSEQSVNITGKSVKLTGKSAKFTEKGVNCIEKNVKFKKDSVQNIKKKWSVFVALICLWSLNHQGIRIYTNKEPYPTSSIEKIPK